VNIDRETVRKILTENLHMRKVCAKTVSKDLTDHQNKEESQFTNTFWRDKIIFWAISLQMMKHRSTNKTLKRSDKLLNGRLPIPHDEKF